MAKQPKLVYNGTWTAQNSEITTTAFVGDILPNWRRSTRAGLKFNNGGSPARLSNSSPHRIRTFRSVMGKYRPPRLILPSRTKDGQRCGNAIFHSWRYFHMFAFQIKVPRLVFISEFAVKDRLISFVIRRTCWSKCFC